MLTLIQFIQLPEQKRLSIMKVNVIESNATDQDMSHPFASKIMSFNQFTQDWRHAITQDARGRFKPDSQADASSPHPDPVVGAHQQTGEAHATTCS